MSEPLRFADYLRATGSNRRELRMVDLMPPPQPDSTGRLRPVPVPPLQLARDEVAAILRPYVAVRFMEQFRTVVPLALYLALFQILILRQLVDQVLLVTLGLFAVMGGLMLFMEGLKLGLMPFGEVIGSILPRKSSLPVVLLITLLLGVGVTFAEPAIGALQAAGQIVSAERAPYLWALLNPWADTLVLVVGASVGIAAVVGTLRFLYGWSLKPLILLTLVPTLGLTLAGADDPEYTKLMGLAWDTGAVTTGPVTVPLVLALGIGIASAAGKGGSGLSGFGIVTLASLFPVLGVLLLGHYIAATTPVADILAAARQAADARIVPLWYQRSPGLELVSGVRAILPLVVFLLLVLTVLLRQRLARRTEILFGIALTVAGMCLFNIGLTYGLSKLGGRAGALVPAAFMEIAGTENSPLFVYPVGLALALLFAWVLGYGATVAEPALNALGVTAQELTNGFIRKRTLIRAVSVGVACGIAAGVAKLVFELPLIWLIVPPYLLAALLTAVSGEEFVNVAWDSAGVTTGPITVPLVLAMGLGFGNATHAIEGFGILSLASIGPIISVLVVGIWSRLLARLQAREGDDGAATARESARP